MVFSKVPKKVDKTPYTVHEGILPANYSLWVQPYLQFVSVDPATKNFALRVERRYFDREAEKTEQAEASPLRVETLAIAKQDVGGEKILEGEVSPSLPPFLTAPEATAGEVTLSQTFANVTAFLSRFEEFYPETHIFVVERQLPDNYKSTRIAQHALSYFMNKMAASPLCPLFLEVDPQLKGKQLGAPKGIKGAQLKSWSVIEARGILAARRDAHCLEALVRCKNKQDDLADTVCQVEALCSFWGLPVTPKMQPEEAEAVIAELVPPLPKAPRKRAAPKEAKAPAERAPRPRAKKISTPLLEQSEVSPASDGGGENTLPLGATKAATAPVRRGRPPAKDRVRAVAKETPAE